MLQQSIYWPKCLARMDSEEFRCWMRETPRENIYFDQGPWLKERISSAEKAQVSCDCTQSSFDQENGICHASLTVHNNSDYPAFPVTVQVEEDQTVHLLSDNGFWLAPKETRKIQLEIFDRSGQEREYTLQIASWNSDTVTVSICS